MRLAGGVPGKLHADLTAYATYCREVVGRSPVAAPAPELQLFVNADRDFHAWLWMPNRPGGGLMTRQRDENGKRAKSKRATARGRPQDKERGPDDA
jgi:hypothetical protein